MLSSTSKLKREEKLCPNKDKELIPSHGKETLNTPPSCVCISGLTSIHYWGHLSHTFRAAQAKESWMQQGPFPVVTFFWKSSPVMTPVDVSTVDRFTLVSKLIGAKKSYSLNKLNLWRGSSVFHVPLSRRKKYNHDPTTTLWEIADDNGRQQSSTLLL